jgi:lysophospholipase L1-like esterase
MLSACCLIFYPQLYLAASDLLGWRLGIPSVEQARLERTLHAIYLRGDSLISANTTVLLGDSHLHSFPTSLLQGPAVNYSIAGETAENLAERVTLYKSLGHVKHVVLLTGRNDLAMGRSPKAVAISIARVLVRIPKTVPIALVGIPPLRHRAAVLSTQEANHLLSAVCSERARCLFIDTQSLADPSGSLRAEFAMADGVHLTSAGYTRLAGLLNDSLGISLPLNSHGTLQ